MGQGITGWVGEHKKPVAITRKAYMDPRFESFSELPEDRFEAFLSMTRYNPPPSACRPLTRIVWTDRALSLLICRGMRRLPTFTPTGLK